MIIQRKFHSENHNAEKKINTDFKTFFNFCKTDKKENNICTIKPYNALCKIIDFFFTFSHIFRKIVH